MKDRLARALKALGLALAVLLAMPHGAPAQSVAEAFERVASSVVVVHTTEWDVADSGSQRTVSVSGFGSGVLISADGRVLTAAHLVHAASEISVEFPEGIRVPAYVIASEPDADVSLLQVERVPAGTVVATLADSDRARIGDRVFAVGTPYGISHTLTVGHLGGRHKPGRVWDRFTLAEFFQTDAAINRGNSGGPMFNMAGEVLGIVSHIISKSGGFEGLGFVVTSNAARKLLLERRSPWWGFEGVLLTGDLLRVFNLKEPGLLVQRVVENSPAARLGLRGGVTKATIGDRSFTVGGDVILRVQGMPCDETHRVHDALAELKAGERLTLTILRRGEIVELAMIVP
ncbi:MAG: S1C family serine protease [Longimicrobiales bacterium]